MKTTPWQGRLRVDLPEALYRRMLGSHEPRSREVLAGALNHEFALSASALGLSLSHTDGLTVGAARARFENEGSAAIGIDVERTERSVSERLLKRISHSSDELSGLTPISIWCIKEALFKAESSHAFFADYCARIEREQDGIHSGTAQCHATRFLWVLGAADGYVTAVAARLTRQHDTPHCSAGDTGKPESRRY